MSLQVGEGRAWTAIHAMAASLSGKPLHTAAIALTTSLRLVVLQQATGALQP